jgi:hypothetical protein
MVELPVTASMTGNDKNDALETSVMIFCSLVPIFWPIMAKTFQSIKEQYNENFSLAG